MQRQQSKKNAKRSQSKIVRDPTNPNFVAFFPEANDRDLRSWRHQRVKSRREVNYVLPPAADGREPKVLTGTHTVNYHVVKYDKNDVDPYAVEEGILDKIKLPNKQCLIDTKDRIYDPYVRGNFDELAHVKPVTHLGHTRPKGKLHGIEKGKHAVYQYDAGFVAAPQYYKNEPEYKKFHGKPRQQQLHFAGNNLMPIPCGPRTFYKNESRDIQTLNQSVYCRGFHCDQKEIRHQLDTQYWPKGGKRVEGDQKGETWTKWAKRMASSFGGGKVGKQVSMWMPKGASGVENKDIPDDSSFDQNLYNQGFSGETMQRLRQNQ